MTVFYVPPVRMHYFHFNPFSANYCKSIKVCTNFYGIKRSLAHFLPRPRNSVLSVTITFWICLPWHRMSAHRQTLNYCNIQVHMINFQSRILRIVWSITNFDFIIFYPRIQAEIREADKQNSARQKQVSWEPFRDSMHLLKLNVVSYSIPSSNLTAVQGIRGTEQEDIWTWQVCGAKTRSHFTGELGVSVSKYGCEYCVDAWTSLSVFSCI